MGTRVCVGELILLASLALLTFEFGIFNTLKEAFTLPCFSCSVNALESRSLLSQCG